MTTAPSSVPKQVLVGLRDSLNRQGLLFGHAAVTVVPEMGPLLALLRDEPGADGSPAFTPEQIQLILDATYGFPQLTDDDARALAQFRRIRRLALRASPLGPDGVDALAVGLAALEVFDLAGTKLKRSAFPSLAKFTSLRGLLLADAKFGDDDLPPLTGLNLTLLDLRGTAVTDAGMAHLAGMHTLEDLRFPDTVTDAGLAALAGLPRLARVHCPTRTTDAGVRALAAGGTLEHVKLTLAKVTDASLEALGRCPALRALDLGRCANVTDAGVAALAGCAALETLNLAGTKVTGACLPTLARIPSLRELHLQHQKITDKDVAALAAISGLHRLMVGRTMLTGQGLATLKRALPACDVNTLG